MDPGKLAPESTAGTCGRGMEEGWSVVEHCLVVELQLSLHKSRSVSIL